MTASRPGVLSTDTEGWPAFAFFNTEKPTDCPRRIWCAYYIYIYPQTTAPFLNKIREFTNEIAILLIKGFFPNKHPLKRVPMLSMGWVAANNWASPNPPIYPDFLIEKMLLSMDWLKIYRKPWFLPWNIGLSCRFSLKPIQWYCKITLRVSVSVSQLSQLQSLIWSRIDSGAAGSPDQRLLSRRWLDG